MTAPSGTSDSYGVPGYHPPPNPGEQGLWVVHVRGGGALMLDIGLVLRCCIVKECRPGPGREALARLLDGIYESLEASR